MFLVPSGQDMELAVAIGCQYMSLSQGTRNNTHLFIPLKAVAQGAVTPCHVVHENNE